MGKRKRRKSKKPPRPKPRKQKLVKIQPSHTRRPLGCLDKGAAQYVAEFFDGHAPLLVMGHYDRAGNRVRLSFERATR